MVLVPEIKLIRTDTTLDLSQKAEKVCSETWSKNLFFLFSKLVSDFRTQKLFWFCNFKKKTFYRESFRPPSSSVHRACGAMVSASDSRPEGWGFKSLQAHGAVV